MESLTCHTSLPKTPLAIIVAMLISTPGLAADFNTSQIFTAANTQPQVLTQSRIRVSSSDPALSILHTDLTLQSVFVSNAGSGAALLVSDSAHLDAQAIDGSTQSNGAPALSVHDRGVVRLAKGSVLTTLGNGSPTALVDGGELHLSDTSLVTHGITSPGIRLSSQSLLQVERSSIETFDMSSAGIQSDDNGVPGVVSDSRIYTHQAESDGVSLNNSGPIALANTQILTEADAAAGVAARWGSQAILNQGSTVHTHGYNAEALGARTGSSIQMNDGTLFSEGPRSAAVLVSGASSISLQNVQGLSIGTMAPALSIEGGSQVSAQDSQLSNADGSTARFIAGQGPGQLTLSNSQLSGPLAVVESEQGSLGNVIAQGSHLITTVGEAFSIQSDSILQASLRNSQVDSPTLAEVIDNGQLQLLASGSSLKGNTLLHDSSRGRLDMQLNTSNWSFEGNSSVSNLELQDAGLLFAGKGYQVLTVNGDLIGHGRFLMKTDLASSQGDLLAVQGQAEGDHEILVADSGRDAQGAPLKLVASGGGSGQFRLVGGHVDAGAFRYGLQHQGNDWYLVETARLAPMQVLAPSRPAQRTPSAQGGTVPMTALAPSQQPQQQVGPTTRLPMAALTPATQPQLVSSQATTIPMTAQNPALGKLGQAQRLSKGANAALGMQTAAANLWQSELGTLTRRLGELREGHDQGGLWTRAMGGRMNVDSGDSRAFEQNLSGAQIGADRSLEQSDATLYLGGVIGMGRSNQNFGEHSSGAIDSRSVALYATYVREDGWYLDSVLKYDHLRGKVKTPSNLGSQVRGHYDADAYGASVELGRTIQLGQGWFVEPQVQLAGVHLQGPKYISSDNLNVDGDATDSVQARAGGRAGRNWQLGSGMQINGYLSASWIDELAGDGAVKVNGHSLDNQLPGSRTELGAGGSLLVSAHQKLMVEVHYANGHEIEQPVALTLGYRYLW
ncbi:autotransporter outer membrane beta-barrel domain-containing protein [Pseudomonas sp. DP-17]|uniref:autotransporter outer membrane beta-barrel domain-containing protein n=1 Tax=Pseudomonas sp. DP-17 TaxID=1580486 RepID=UPI001EFB56FC|nr:autotransporter outer membrane beta-barrel domain-containing protein [Pseudomonas sp. DP-17]MCG8907189.1 autotransporter outer membrane beta-barrel domain-containing protein [Pseudomonas sp. DP-17]